MSAEDLLKEAEARIEMGNLALAKKTLSSLAAKLEEEPLPQEKLRRIAELVQFAQGMQLVGMAQTHANPSARAWIKEVISKIRNIEHLTGRFA